MSVTGVPSESQTDTEPSWLPETMYRLLLKTETHFFKFAKQNCLFISFLIYMSVLKYANTGVQNLAKRCYGQHSCLTSCYLVIFFEQFLFVLVYRRLIKKKSSGIFPMLHIFNQVESDACSLKQKACVDKV